MECGECGDPDELRQKLGDICGVTLLPEILPEKTVNFVDETIADEQVCLLTAIHGNSISESHLFDRSGRS